MNTVEHILSQLRDKGDPAAMQEQARVGIVTAQAYGVKVPHIRAIAKEYKKDHELALAFWDTGVHEARILASMVDDHQQVTETQVDAWVSDFNSWDLCDQCCANLFVHTPFAYDKAHEWSERQPEFEKRTGFAMMAYLPIHDKKAPDGKFIQFLNPIKREATDERNFVKKAVNWALRNIGKRSLMLHSEAIRLAKEIETIDDKTAQWIAKDALRELQSEKIIAKIKERDAKKN